MRRKLKSFLLQLPVFVLLIGAVIGSWIIKIADLYPLPWGTPILLTIIVALYFWGRKLEKSPYEY